MTDPIDPTGLPPAPPAPPAPLAAAPAAQAEPWQLRLEVLAAILVASVAVALVSAFISADAQLSTAMPSFPGSGQADTDWTEVIRVAGAFANLMVAGALLVALLLVTLGPGDRIGRRGSFVLRILVGLGLVTAGLAAVSSVLTLTAGDDGPLSYAGFQTGLGTEGFVPRLAAVAPLLAAAVIAGYVAWCAFTTLGDVPHELVAPDEPDSDLGASAEGHWAPPPAPLP